MQRTRWRARTAGFRSSISTNSLLGLRAHAAILHEAAVSGGSSRQTRLVGRIGGVMLAGFWTLSGGLVALALMLLASPQAAGQTGALTRKSGSTSTAAKARSRSSRDAAALESSRRACRKPAARRRPRQRPRQAIARAIALTAPDRSPVARGYGLLGKFTLQWAASRGGGGCTTGPVDQRTQPWPELAQLREKLPSPGLGPGKPRPFRGAETFLNRALAILERDSGPVHQTPQPRF